MSATVAAMTAAIIGVAGGLAAVLLGAFLTWRKTLRDREHRARVVARRLIPDVDELRLKLNEALRTNQPGTLTPEQATLETWTADAQEAIAALRADDWELISTLLELIRRTLDKDVFPNLHDDGKVGKEAAQGALVCSLLCSQLLFWLDRLAADPQLDPQKKIDKLAEQTKAADDRLRDVPQLHPDLQPDLESQEFGRQRAELLALQSLSGWPPGAPPAR